MKLRIYKTSDVGTSPKPKPCKDSYLQHGDWYINLVSVEQLMDIYKEVGHSLIVTDRHIEIYDEYRE